MEVFETFVLTRLVARDLGVCAVALVIVSRTLSTSYFDEKDFKFVKYRLFYKNLVLQEVRVTLSDVFYVLSKLIFILEILRNPTRTFSLIG